MLASGASLDVFCDPCFGAWPEVFFVDASNRFVSAGMAIDRTLVPNVHQFVFQSLIGWYDESAAFGVPPEWFVWVVDSFDWIDARPFFH